MNEGAGNKQSKGTQQCRKYKSKKINQEKVVENVEVHHVSFDIYRFTKYVLHLPINANIYYIVYQYLYINVNIYIYIHQYEDIHIYIYIDIYIYI